MGKPELLSEFAAMPLTALTLFQGPWKGNSGTGSLVQSRVSGTGGFPWKVIPYPYSRIPTQGVPDKLNLIWA